jgi:DUF4097 and DUF4098 domain-containing protein YvlB
MRREAFPVRGPLRVEASIPAGELEVEAVDTDEAVVELEPLRGNDDTVEKARVELRGDTLKVEVRDRRANEVRVRVVAPSGSRLDARVASADVRTSGALGDVDIKAASGDVALGEIGSLDAKLASGDLNVAQVGGDAKVQSASGDVEVGRLAGEGSISTASGDVHLGETLAGLRLQTASGDQQVDSLAAGETSIKSASGDVRVGIRKGSRLWVDANSAAGDVMSELEVGDAEVGDDGPMIRLQITTMSGDIELVRAP